MKSTFGGIFGSRLRKRPSAPGIPLKRTEEIHKELLKQAKIGPLSRHRKEAADVLVRLRKGEIDKVDAIRALERKNIFLTKRQINGISDIFWQSILERAVKAGLPPDIINQIKRGSINQKTLSQLRPLDSF